MTDNQRIKVVYEYLKKNKIVRNQQHFTDLIESDAATVSQVMNNKLSVPNNMFGKIHAAFPEIQKDWLENGVGEMIRTEINQTVNGDQNKLIGNGDYNSNSNNSGVPASIAEKALNEISAQRKLTERTQDMLAEAQKSINELSMQLVEIIKRYN